MRISVLYESAYTTSDLNDYIVDLGYDDEEGVILIEILHRNVINFWSDPNNVDPKTRKQFQSNIPDRLARAELEKYNEFWTIHPEAYVKGWGPLIYEIGIEYATQNGAGMIPATGISKMHGMPMSDTAASANVWKKFYGRSDVQHRAINNLQPPELHCVYTKPPVIINHLKALHKLRS